MKKIMVLIFVLSLFFSPRFIFAADKGFPPGAMEKNLKKANKLARANVEKETKKRQREAKKRKKEQQRAKKKAQREQRLRQKAMEKQLKKYKE